MDGADLLPNVHRGRHRPAAVPASRRRLRRGPGWARVLAVAAFGFALSAPGQADDAAWPVAGEQGLVRYVIVPAERVRDRAAYARQIERLCAQRPTCFVNFYANPGGAPLAVPLPAAIEAEATAVYRRSGKQQAERFLWSCRLQLGPEPCF
ncbi:hypothetical protein [Azohydromonas sediminis]|uniref:hypothetical protein n=1 Tax=Azohydromonas sediminis TaxID=2259674 RepID=UPI001B357B0F|nr:hypothetical protein [Azohydromonas sediminis]